MKVKTAKPETVHFEAGDEILHEGNTGTVMYIIKKGQVEVYEKASRVPGQEERIPLAIIQSGEFLGEMGVLTGKPVCATAIALTNVEAIKFTKDMIEAQIKDVPSWLLSLTKGALHRLRVMNEIIRRNGIVDDRLLTAIEAAEEKLREDEEKEAS